MAVTNLNVNGNSVNGTRNWDTNMDYLNIDEIPAGADGNAIIDNTNGNSAQVASFLLANLPSNWSSVTVTNVQWYIRRRVSGAQTDVRVLGVRIVTETDGTVLAAATAGGAFAIVGTITNTTFTNGSITAFAYINTGATKAQWDDARIEFQNDVSKVHGGDTNGMQIDSVQIQVTFNGTGGLVAQINDNTATVTGDLTAKQGEIDSTINNVATVTGDLTAKQGSINSSINNVATTSGILIGKANLNGLVVPGDRYTCYVPITEMVGNLMEDGDLEGHVLLAPNVSINAIETYLIKTGTFDSAIEMRIYSVLGGLPNSLLQTSSNKITVANHSSSKDYRFYFDGTTYTQYIAIVIATVDWVSGSNPNGFIVHKTQSKRKPLSEGYSVGWNGISWYSDPTKDFIFRIFNQYPVSGALNIAFAIANITGVSTVTGSLSYRVPIQGLIGVGTNTSGTLIGEGLIAGTIDSIATIIGYVSNVLPILGTANGIATIEGILSTAPSLISGVSDIWKSSHDPYPTYLKSYAFISLSVSAIPGTASRVGAEIYPFNGKIRTLTTYFFIKNNKYNGKFRIEIWTQGGSGGNPGSFLEASETYEVNRFIGDDLKNLGTYILITFKMAGNTYNQNLAIMLMALEDNYPYRSAPGVYDTWDASVLGQNTIAWRSGFGWINYISDFLFYLNKTHVSGQVINISANSGSLYGYIGKYNYIFKANEGVMFGESTFFTNGGNRGVALITPVITTVIHEIEIWVRKSADCSPFTLFCDIYNKDVASQPTTFITRSITAYDETDFVADEITPIKFVFPQPVFVNNDDLFILFRTVQWVTAGKLEISSEYDTDNDADPGYITLTTSSFSSWQVRFSGFLNYRIYTSRDGIIATLTNRYLHGLIPGTTTISGSLSYRRPLSGTINCTSSVTALEMVRSNTLWGNDVIVGIATTTGTLVAKGNMLGLSDNNIDVSYRTQEQIQNAFAITTVTKSVAACFLPGFNSKISTVELNLRKSSTSYNGTVVLQIWSCPTDFPATLLETSINSYVPSQLSTSSTWVPFHFTNIYYDQPIAFKLVETVRCTSNGLNWNMWNTTPPTGEWTGEKTATQNNSDTWSQFNYALSYKIYESVSLVTVTGTLSVTNFIYGIATVTGALTAKGLIYSQSPVLRKQPLIGSFQQLSATTLRYGQRIIVPVTGNIKRITTFLRNGSSPSTDGTLGFQIWSLNGSNVPLAVLETSTTVINQNSLPPNGQPFKAYHWEFSGNAYNEKIALILYQPTVTTTGQVHQQSTGANTIPNENQIWYTTGWFNDNTFDLNYIIYYDDIPIVSTVEGILTDANGGELLGAIDGLTTVTAILTASGSLAGSSNGSSTTTVSSITLKITATSNGVASTQGLLHADAKGFGISNGSATTASTLIAKGDLDDAVDGIGSTTGALSGKGGLGGTINGATTITAVLSAENVQIEVVINGVATVSATLTANGQLIGASNPALVVSGVLQARGGLVISINGVATVSGSLSSDAPLVGIINGVATTSATLIAKGDLDDSIDNITIVTGTLSASGSLVGTINGVATNQGNLSLIGILAGESNGVATTSGILTANAILLGESNGVASVVGVLTANGSLAGSSDGVTAVQGIVVSNILITDPINGTATTSGTLTANGNLSGVSNGSTTITGATGSNAFISGIINGQATVSGILIAKGDLDSPIDNLTTVTGTLSGSGAIAGASNGTSSTSGVLLAKGSLSGTINGTSTTQGIIANNTVAGTSNGSTTTSGVLSGLASLVGIVSGQATTDGILVSDAIAGVTNGTATTQGTLSANGALLGTANGLASLTGVLIAKGDLDDATDGITTVTGTLTADGSLIGETNGLTNVFGSILSDGEALGESNGITTTQGTLTSKGDLDTSIDNPTTVTGTLTANAELSGVSNGIALTDGTLTAKGSLSGASNGIASLNGIILTDGQLIGIIEGTVVVTGVLTSNGVLSGTINGITVTTATLTAKGDTDSSIDNPTTVTGILTGTGNLIGIANGLATVEGLLTNGASIGTLEGTSDGLATTFGTLTARGSLQGTSNGSTALTGVVFTSALMIGQSDGLTIVTAVLTGKGSLAGISQPIPDEYVIGTGNLFEAFEVDDESIGQTINIRNKAVEWFEFEFDKIGSPDFTIQGEIWSLDGGGLPLNLIQVSENTIQATSVTGTRADYRFNFNIDTINYDGDYALVAHIVAHTVGNGTNYIRRYYDDNNPFTGGYEVFNLIGIAWDRDLGNDLNGRVRLKKSVAGNIVGTSYGIANGLSSVVGTLTGTGSLTGQSDGTSDATVTFVELEGIANGIATVTGSIRSVGVLEGQIDGQASVLGNLTTNYLSGESNASNVFTRGILSGIGGLEGTTDGIATTSAEGLFKGLLTGSSNGSTIATASLSAKGALVGSSNASAEVYVWVQDAYEAIIDGSAEVTGTLTSIGPIEGVIDGTSQALVLIVPTYKVYGRTNGVAIVIGTLTTKAPPPPDNCIFYPVKYVEKGPYLVEYKTEYYRVVYLCKK